MLRPISPVLEYVINKDYIAEFLCINQNKAELQCNGKCYLMQKLTEQNTEKKENFPKIAMEEYPIGFIKLLSITTSAEKTQSTPLYNSYQNQYTFIYSDTCFHPPNFCS